MNCRKCGLRASGMFMNDKGFYCSNCVDEGDVTLAVEAYPDQFTTDEPRSKTSMFAILETRKIIKSIFSR